MKINYLFFIVSFISLVSYTSEDSFAGFRYTDPVDRRTYVTVPNGTSPEEIEAMKTLMGIRDRFSTQEDPEKEVKLAEIPFDSKDFK